MAARKTPDGTAYVNTTESSDGSTLKVGSLGALSDNGDVNYRPKTAIFMKRRGSAGPDGRVEGPVPVKASLNEMRQNLRLGPANSAAHPRSAKKGVFKIKQGLTRVGTRDSIPEQTNGDADTARDERTPLLPNNDGDSGTAVKPYGANGKSKGKKNGKNGKKK